MIKMKIGISSLEMSSLIDYVNILNAKTSAQVEKFEFMFDEERHSKLFAQFQDYIKENKDLYPKYRFWYDGSNYGGTDSVIVVREGTTYKGGCWSRQY